MHAQALTHTERDTLTHAYAYTYTHNNRSDTIYVTLIFEKSRCVRF